MSTFGHHGVLGSLALNFRLIMRMLGNFMCGRIDIDDKMSICSRAHHMSIRYQLALGAFRYHYVLELQVQSESINDV
jgi:hypothetical protein